MNKIKYIFIIIVVYTILIWVEYIYLRDYNIHRLLNPESYDNPFVKSINMTTYLRKEKIVFAGLARNIDSKIEKSIQNCVLLGSFFECYKIVIFENDSMDNTRPIIEKLASQNSNIQLVKCMTNPDCKFNECELYTYGIMNKNRIDRMVYFRNIYLSVIYSTFNEYDFLCTLDFDIDGTIPIQGLLHAIDCPLEWSCICANGRSGIPGTFGILDTMYDAMALCITEDDMEKSKRGNRSMKHLIAKYIRLMFLSHFEKGVTDGFIPILSAFNGFAIYKLKDLLQIYYKNGYSCEHVSLHDQLVHSNKKIFIDLFLTIYVGHQGPRKISQFWK